MKISIIAAVAKNGVIGLNNKMPWHISGDLKYFRAKTIGKPMIMGRNTFESMGKLPGRTSIVITRNQNYQADKDVVITDNLNNAIKAAKLIAHRDGQDEIMIVGGAQIYKLGMELADCLYITEVDIKPKGDVFFPEFDKTNWAETSRKPIKAGTNDESNYAFVALDRA